jgi:hypothetical protein
MAVQQGLQQDALLKATQQLQDSSSSSSSSTAGFLIGSLPLSRAAHIQRQQRQLAAAAEFTSWDLDDIDSHSGDISSSSGSSAFGSSHRADADSTDYDADDADDDVTLVSLRGRQQQRQQQLGASSTRRLAGSSGSRRLLGSSSSSGWGLVQQRGYRHERRTPDLLEYLECTNAPTTPAAAGVQPAALLGDGSAAAAAAAAGEAAVKGLPLNLPLDR